MDITEFTLLNKYNKNGKIFNVYYTNSPDFDESLIRLNFEHTEFRYFTYNEILTSKEFIPGTIDMINDYIKSYYRTS